MDFCHPHYHNVINAQYMLKILRKQSCYEATVLTDPAMQNSDVIRPQAQQNRNALILFEIRQRSLNGSGLIVMLRLEREYLTSTMAVKGCGW